MYFKIIREQLLPTMNGNRGTWLKSRGGKDATREDKTRYKAFRFSGISFTEKTASNRKTVNFELNTSHNFSVIFQ